VVISTLGKDAIVYCGAPSCQAGLKDQPLQAVPAQGLDLHNLAPDSQLVLSDGKNTRNLTIESANGSGDGGVSWDQRQHRYFAGDLERCRRGCHPERAAAEAQPEGWAVVAQAHAGYVGGSRVEVGIPGRA
jgi:hypothetical protein